MLLIAARSAKVPGMPEGTIHARGNVPLIVLVEHPARLCDQQVDAALGELFQRNATAGSDFHSGYLLGVENPAPFPNTRELLSAIKNAVIASEARRWAAEFHFSFLKAHQGTPPEASEGVYYEGLHLDSHPALSDGIELLRVLVNLSRAPRHFRFADTDCFELARLGVPVGKRDFVQLNLPASLRTFDVEIPGRTNDRLCALRFWASVVPHVGINLPHGSCLASFEAPIDYRAVRIA